MSQAEVAASSASDRTLCTRCMMIKASHMPAHTLVSLYSLYNPSCGCITIQEGQQDVHSCQHLCGASLQHLPRLQPVGHEQVLTGVSGTHLEQNPRNTRGSGQGVNDVMERSRCGHVGRRDCVSKLVFVTLHPVAHGALEQVGNPASIVG